MTRGVVEVFADVVCPFTHVGLRRVVRRRVELGLSRPLLRVRAWPLERVNGAPLDVASIVEHVEELRGQVAPDLFRGFDGTAFPTSSIPALAVAARAYAQSDQTGERVSLALRDALFEEGRDIGDPVVLEAIARTHGLPPPTPAAERAVLADLDEGRRRQVRGSPEFFLDGHGYFCPALRIEKVADAFEIALDIEGFDAFLAACFG